MKAMSVESRASKWSRAMSETAVPCSCAQDATWAEVPPETGLCTQSGPLPARMCCRSYSTSNIARELLSQQVECFPEDTTVYTQCRKVLCSMALQHHLKCVAAVLQHSAPSLRNSPTSMCSRQGTSVKGPPIYMGRDGSA